ncbi:MAG TPA: ABC transporter substrate-binding protein [Gemmataceae bacterium]|nr:ABC transporter substrate-binding protein [Gemmataceae bacterium]
MSLFSLRWLALAGLFLAVAAVPAQPPAKGKAPPAKEEEDPAAKPVKPPPSLEDAPKADATPAEGPGEPPPAGVLVVGVNSLPVLMSPQFARTDSEKFALDLLFEGLLRPGIDGAGGRVYEPALARELPTLVPLGREFTLTNAAWGEPDQQGLPVTAADVVSTFEKLKARQGQPGAEVADWIDSVKTVATNRCTITLTRGHIDPLSLMTFKVLPSNQKDDLAFARKPVGSGPFVYAGRQTKGGRVYAIFPANPAYRRPDPPKLSAVWMVATRNPVADFKSKLFHFALTTHTGQLAALKPPPQPVGGQVGKLEVNIGNLGHVDTVFSRRIYLLAVNHQSAKLGEGEKGRELRKFLAHAIQRDAILTACFRAGFGEHHQPLTGPFLPNTWPCNGALAGRLDDPDLARSLRSREAGKVDLVLKYPAGDPAVAEACKLMAQQVAEANAGVTLKPTPVAADDYYQQIVYNTDFDLAYWHYDYPNDWFSPAGLLDSSARGHGGRNFMRYTPSSAINDLLVKCQDRREFGVVQQAMRQLHTTFGYEVPFIPLWHLDTHALLAVGLETVPPAPQLDPLAPFTHIEQWSVH